MKRLALAAALFIATACGTSSPVAPSTTATGPIALSITVVGHKSNGPLAGVPVALVLPSSTTDNRQRPETSGLTGLAIGANDVKVTDAAGRASWSVSAGTYTLVVKGYRLTNLITDNASLYISLPE